MTREEAVEVLKERYLTCVGIGLDNHANRVNEAIDMAIEALQREEAEAKGYCHRIIPKEYLKNDAIKPSNDVINRADAIKAVAEHFSFDDGCSNIYKDIDYYKGIAEHILKNVPSAKQVTSKLKNPCDSLLTEESNGSKEHKSKLDLISRQDVIEALSRSSVYAWSIEQDQTAHNWALNIIKALPSADITLTETCEKCQETTERVLNNQGKKIKICAYCKYKGKAQMTDTEGFTYSEPVRNLRIMKND